MPTILTHALVGAGLASLGPASLPRGRLAFTLAALSVLPDLDVLAFRLHIPYSHWAGHRGLSHSLAFALVVAAVVAGLERRRLPAASPDGWRFFALCTAALASHGLLDALTDGGLGIAFFLPFDATRHFFPVRPLAVSPIGVDAFVAGPALAVLRSEILVVWLPLAALVAARELVRRRAVQRSAQ